MVGIHSGGPDKCIAKGGKGRRPERQNVVFAPKWWVKVNQSFVKKINC